MSTLLGIIGPVGITLLVLLYGIIVFYSLFLLFRNEKGWPALLWTLVVLAVPVLGGLT
ncbi:MAG TPA: hypothetical protein PKE63_08745 [Lacibacter sp.]|nr:hypothetical protein [Lacibacter sp.]HMO87898.1 hypothetical protein [Lacibacter sp.]HMP87351.1 hypothetical protein [Lacibacter sp.]